MFMKIDQIFWLLSCFIATTTVNGFIELNWEPVRPAFDPEIYQNALNSELCDEQLQHIQNNVLLRFKFIEAGMRIPKAITELNNVDYGNYDQCLGINEDLGTSVIEGKYCMIRAPINDELMKVAEEMNWSELHPSIFSEENLNKFIQIQEMQIKLEDIRNRVNRARTIIDTPTLLPTLRMALCVPKTCTTQEGMTGLLFNLTRLGFIYEDEFCRFKNDKPWVPGDYVAISIFFLITLLTILSTSYDILHTFIFKTDPKSVSGLYKAFSVYTNGRRLTTFTHNPNNLNCVDGIRAISMFWIIVGHSYMLSPAIYNLYYVYVEYVQSLKAQWLLAVPFTVDTFFFIAGMLLVYTAVGKISRSKLLKSLHMFYLSRLLRMFPLLATLVLLQATLLFKIADGPDWNGSNTENTNACRTYWWTTLLYIQNYVGFRNHCIPHSWYLAIDIQCYFVSPLVLYWVLNKNKKTEAWIALTCGVLTTLTVATTYCFIQQFRGWNLGQNREDGNSDYQNFYYHNTLTRAPPFFIGMLFGNVLSEWKGRQPQIPYYLNALLWILSGGTMLTLIYVTYLMKDSSWDYWIINDLHNSFGRSIWVLAIAWIIFACQHGYGGPVNWFLCHDIWKLPSRISYGMYLFHYPIQYVIGGMARQPIFFSDTFALYNFLAQVLLAFGVVFVLTLVIDSPCSVLIKYVLGGGIKNQPQKDLRS